MASREPLQLAIILILCPSLTSLFVLLHYKSTSLLQPTTNSHQRNMSGNVHDTGDFDFRSFFMDIPPVTRTLFLTVFTSTVLSTFSILPISLFILEWPSIARFQFWRLAFTFLHMGRLGISFLIDMYFLYTYSKQLEIGVFFGRPANYAWFLTIVSTTVLALSFIFSPFQGFFNAPSILIAIIHLWGRHASNVTVSLYGFIRIPAKYLSLTLIALGLLMQGAISPPYLFGLLGGHLYYFLDSVYPTMPNGKVLITCPIWFERFIDQVQAFLASVTGLHSNVQTQVSGAAPNNRQQAPRRSGVTDIHSTPQGASSGWRAGLTRPGQRYNWGSGQTLGSS